MYFPFDELPSNSELFGDEDVLDMPVGLGYFEDHKISQEILDRAEADIRAVFGDVEVIEHTFD